jgi:hypothetical protein
MKQAPTQGHHRFTWVAPTCLAGCVLGGSLLLSPAAWAKGKNCSFRSAGQLHLTFGALDPSRAERVQREATATQSSDLEAGDCARGHTMRITTVRGLHNLGQQLRMRNGSGGNTYLRYTVQITPNPTQGPGNGSYTGFSLQGIIEPADIAAAPAGTYQDALQISVTP